MTPLLIGLLMIAIITGVFYIIPRMAGSFKYFVLIILLGAGYLIGLVIISIIGALS